MDPTWKDPYPAPIVTQVEDFRVVRDDLIQSGTKARALDYLIGHAPEFAHIKEWVYGSTPAHGYAQIALGDVCRKYGKKAVIFAARRKPENLHEYQRRAIDSGVDFRWVNMGMLSVTQCRAREYAAGADERELLPLGLDHEYVTQAIVQAAQTIVPPPTEFWTAGSSGVLTRALQKAWPDADAHVVQIHHKMKPEELGRARLHVTDVKPGKPCPKADRPPFPSAVEYDAKVWKVMKQHASPGALFWNVGA